MLNRIFGLAYVGLCGLGAAIFYYAEVATDHAIVVAGTDIPWGFGLLGTVCLLLAIWGALGLLGRVAVLTQPLEALERAVVADGMVDAQEVTKIRWRLLADGRIDREEADFLFAVNRKTTGEANDASWRDLFVEALTMHVLEDDVSPGRVDDDEAAWLIRNVESDGQIDDCGRALLASIKVKASWIAKSLTAKMDEWGV